MNFKKNKIGNTYILIGVVIIFILIIGGILLLLNLKPTNANLEQSQDNDSESKEGNFMNCEINEDCSDEDKCTLESCTGGICIISDVLLCYNGDGCCPKNCNSGNDNDCLGV